MAASAGQEGTLCGGTSAWPASAERRLQLRGAGARCYYVLFDRLMAHWQRAFPARILEVSYEGLVDSQEASSRQLVEFCGLPWDDACLHFEENAAAVNTPNAWQVRAPIYRGAVKRWKNFEPQLGALRMLLEEAGIVVDD
ncbi:MAG: hypothetical protein WDW38_004223 [Sanguina aurantia]